jgi:hypothetical protein
MPAPSLGMIPAPSLGMTPFLLSEFYLLAMTQFLKLIKPIPLNRLY